MKLGKYGLRSYKMDLKQQIEEQKQALLRIASQEHKKKIESISAKDIEEDIKLNELWYQALLYKKETGIINKSERATLHRIMNKIKKENSSLIDEEYLKKEKRKIYMRLYNKSHR